MRWLVKADFAATGKLPWPQYDAGAGGVYALEAGTFGPEPRMPAATFI